jgi:hypothetical protein
MAFRHESIKNKSGDTLSRVAKKCASFSAIPWTANTRGKVAGSDIEFVKGDKSSNKPLIRSTRYQSSTTAHNTPTPYGLNKRQFLPAIPHVSTQPTSLCCLRFALEDSCLQPAHSTRRRR